MGSRRRHMALASLISRQAIDAPRRPKRHWDPMLAGQRPTYAFLESIRWPKRPNYAFRNTCNRSSEVGWWPTRIRTWNQGIMRLHILAMDSTT